MGNLAGSRVYLCGAVEVESDPNNWRALITPALEMFGLVVLNPLIKPPWMPAVDGKAQRAFKESLIQNPNEKINYIKKNNDAARNYCLALVKMCDFTIVKLTKTFTVGTWEEISIARGKPCFIICDDLIPSMWLMSQLNIYDNIKREIYIHKSLDSCLTRLARINSNKNLEFDLNLDPFDWIFIRYKK